MLTKEKEKLLDLDPLVIIEYIKTSIEILLNLKMDTSAMSGNGGGAGRIHSDNSLVLNTSHLTNNSNYTSTTNHNQQNIS